MLKRSSVLSELPQESIQGESRAIAGVNIALIKYWGKADESSNLPAVGSLSMTLDAWGSDTTLAWVDHRRLDGQQTVFPKNTSHRFILNGEERVDPKVNRLLDHLLQIAIERGHPWASPEHVRAVIESRNSVPTASGLASSASGMAALGLAAWSALGWEVPSITGDLRTASPLIDIVRIGSGSAVRSLLGGFVRLERDGRSMSQLCSSDDWPLALVVCVIDPGPKAVSSRAGMERTRKTSPFYPAWVESHEEDLIAATEAVKSRDLQRLGELMEHSTFKMHASMWASRPPLRYLRSETLSLLDAVERLRKTGVGAWATMDAGPHVKVLCTQAEAKRVAEQLSELPGVDEVLIRYPGEAPRVMKGGADG